MQRSMSRAGGLSLNSDSMADRRGGGDRGSYTSPTLPCGSYPFVNLREANTLLRMHRMIEKERSEQMAEPILSGYLSNLGKYTEGRPAGEWVTFPTTAEHLKEVFDRIGIDFKHYEEWHFTEFQSTIPGLTEHLSEYSHPDELNYLGKLLEMQFDDDREKFIAAIEYGDHADSLQDIINLAQNLDCYWIYPSVHNEEEYGRYLVDELEEPELPEEAKKYFMYEEYGRDASINDDGMFTEKGYIYNNRNTFTEWYDGRDVPEEYRVTPQPPQPERPDPSKVEMDAAAPGQRTAQTAEQPQEPRPVIPIVLTSEKPAEKLKEITDRLEQGIAELFDSERYREYLKVMSKFHNYSFRNTVLIAMQKPDASLVAGFSAWKNNFTPETIYRVRRNPYSDSRENSYLLQAYVTQENGRAKMGDVLYTGTPEKCRELMGQLKSGELTEGDVKQLYAKAQETAQTAGQDKDTFSIYQIKGGDETRDFRFEPYDRLQAAGNVVDRANYELVYSAPLAPETSLEDIYTCFNIDHPKDFKGHSLSVSDVVVLHQDGQDAAHFVDSVGFREVPEFLQEQKQLTPDDLETGETVKTPRGTFHVTAMSREQIEAAGYGFHHQSDDGKYLIMGNGTRAFAVAAEQAQRDNPLKTAEQTTEQNGNMIDGIINNTPTVDELEAKVKAGEQISLVDLANAVKADKERGKGAKPEKKPSIRAQLRADKEKAQKKNAKQKSQDLERS